ncbi:cell division protein FtsQ [Flavobacterium amnicola]|uniref:Cell division protein FtsQ n=1 Tax=Flavobacterium amnicola TaxID=2506422 RepID=A0A4Q1K631_9FLAO|nr:cell division protein FtsQ [Flavobacterium amnicola]RXR20634.1 cell division protein FtsQ [Flavobacterium amnicola]
MRKNWFINIQLIAILGLVVFLYSFTSKRNENRKIGKPAIEILDANNPFITSEMVNKLLIESFGGTSTIRKEKLDLKNIEQTINKHSLIDHSEVYVSVDGKLKTVITQKTPIARVFDENSSFYIDYKGNRMPLSQNFSARVPLVYGDMNNTYSKNFVSLLQMVHKDDFLKKNIIGMTISADGSIVMKNRNYGYDIIFGRTIHMERKFNNYKAFFQKAVQDTLLDSYKTINLKFTKQVVCTK